jgi:hypothetical protein
MDRLQKSLSLYSALVKRKISPKEIQSIKELILRGDHPCAVVISVYKSFQERNSFLGPKKTSNLPMPENNFGRKKMLALLNEEDEKSDVVQREIRVGEVFGHPIEQVSKHLGTARKRIIRCVLDRRYAWLDEGDNILGWKLSTVTNEGFVRVSEFPTNIRKIRIQEFMLPDPLGKNGFAVNYFTSQLISIRIEEAKAQTCFAIGDVLPTTQIPNPRNDGLNFHFVGLASKQYFADAPWSVFQDSLLPDNYYRKVSLRTPLFPESVGERGTYDSRSHEGFMMGEFEFYPPLQEITSITLSFFREMRVPYFLDTPAENRLALMIPMEFECE